MLHSFLSNVAAGIKVSAVKSQLELARKLNERSKLVQKRKLQRQRIKKLAKELTTIEAQIQIVNSDIQRIEECVNTGSDNEED